MSQVDAKIDALREIILRYILYILSILVLFNTILIAYRAANYGGWSVFYIQFLVAIIIWTTTLYQNKIQNHTKAYILTFLALLTVSSGMYGFGFLASSKILVGWFPVFISFILSYKKAIKTLILFLIVYVTFATLYITGILEYSYDLQKYSLNYHSWILDYVSISIVAWGLLYVGYQFEMTIKNNFLKIETQNKELTENEEKYRTLFESSNDAIILIEDGKYFSCNKKTYELFNCTPDYLIGKSPSELSPLTQPDGEDSNTKAANLFKKTIKGEPQVFDWQHIKESGELFDASISLNLVVLNDKKYTQAVLRDITEKKAILEELSQHRNNLEQIVAIRTKALEDTNKELQAKNQIISDQINELKISMERLHEAQQNLVKAEKMASLGILTSGVAHEINNPLNYIMGGYIGLQDYFNQYGSKENETTDILLNSIKTGVERASIVVKELNQLRGENNIIREICDINSILDHCLVMLEDRIPTEITVTKSFYHGNLTLNGNSNKLHQLFINIILNATQSIPKTGTIVISTAKNEGSIIIKIADTGVGISKQILPKITDPFYTTKDPGKGTGLGLSIAYHTVQDHQGTLEFESEEGKGTVAIITLPLTNTL